MRHDTSRSRSHRSRVFERRPLLLGVVHLAPLPGAPRWSADDGAGWVARAVRDATTLVEAGFDGVIVENLGDAPYHARRVEPATVAAMAVAVARVREAVGEDALVGVNVLRNDALAALAVAAAADADLVRVNVLAGAVVTDQGLVEGEAAAVARARAGLAPHVRLFADVAVKHGAPLAPRALAEETADLVQRAGADALLVTGKATGAAVAVADLREVREAAGDVPVLVASGATAGTIGDLLAHADGAIVGTAVERGGVTGAPVERRRARRFMAAARQSA